MATKQSENKHSFASLILVVVILGSLAVLAFVPMEIFDAVRMREQRQIVSWLGEESDQWIMDRILDALSWMNSHAVEAMEASAASGNTKIDTWIVQRIHATTIWIHVVLYRMGMLLMWLIFGLPCMLAAFIDGHFQRRISQSSFSSQSPMLHKSGVELTKIVLALLLAWIFAPLFISTIVAPIAIAGFSVGWWMWVAHLQKRL